MEPNYDVNATVDFWVPASPNPERLKQPSWNVVGRLRDGATLDRAHAELTVLTANQAKADRDFEGIAPRLQSLTTETNRDGRRILLPLLEPPRSCS
jgi:putative ABC transport system permease protein